MMSEFEKTAQIGLLINDTSLPEGIRNKITEVYGKCLRDDIKPEQSLKFWKMVNALYSSGNSIKFQQIYYILKKQGIKMAVMTAKTALDSYTKDSDNAVLSIINKSLALIKPENIKSKVSLETKAMLLRKVQFENKKSNDTNTTKKLILDCLLEMFDVDIDDLMGNLESLYSKNKETIDYDDISSDEEEFVNSLIEQEESLSEQKHSHTENEKLIDFENENFIENSLDTETDIKSEINTMCESGLDKDIDVQEEEEQEKDGKSLREEIILEFMTKSNESICSENDMISDTLSDDAGNADECSGLNNGDDKVSEKNEIVNEDDEIVNEDDDTNIFDTFDRFEAELRKKIDDENLNNKEAIENKKRREDWAIAQYIKNEESDNLALAKRRKLD